MRDELKVRVVRRTGRKYFQAEWDDPTTGKTLSKSTGKTTARDAHKVATQIEQELRDGTYGRDFTPWADFRSRYLEEGLTGRADATYRNAVATLNLIEKLINPKSPQVINEAVISKFRNKLTHETVNHPLPGGSKEACQISRATVNRHLRTVRAMLNWAEESGIIRRAPTVKELPAAANAKARGITAEEFERMLAATAKVIESTVDHLILWKRLLRGLWASGLRLGEALELRWYDGPIHIETCGKRPAVRFSGVSQKNRKDQVVPIVPEFWALLNEIPEAEREGYVFDVRADRVKIGEKSFAVTSRRVDVVGKVITEIGKAARVKVNESGKPASAHDLRRAFGCRWSTKVTPTVLCALMRHGAIATTMKYYLSDASDAVADVVWSGQDASRTDIFTDTEAPTGDGGDAQNEENTEKTSIF